MEIFLDLSPLVSFINLEPERMVWVFFINFAWPFLAVIILIGIRDMYLGWLRGQWSLKHKFVLLAIDIPRLNEQSPKAVENMFTYLGGAHGSVSFFEKWFEGVYQKSFSFEIVSISGHTQFMVRTPLEWRNLVESAVYSQYPDAEIFEVEDYVDAVPHNVPDEEYDFWGTEFIQGAPAAYPIKCYKEFEHQMGPSEMQFKDPMASLMDLCSSLGEGEQLWFQIIVIPRDFAWIKSSEKEINKLLGRKEKVKEGLIIRGLGALGEASEAIYPIWGDIDSSKKKEEKAKTMLDMSPGEVEKVEAIQAKASKLGFDAKLRVIYMSKKEVMNRGKVVSGFVGFIKQFMSLNLNNLKPELKRTATKTAYFMKAKRLISKKKKLLSAYISRSDWRGALPGVFNIEELATIWHFPVEPIARSSMLQKVPGRKADAPASLPLDDGTINAGGGSFLNFVPTDEDEGGNKETEREEINLDEDIIEESSREEFDDILNLSSDLPPNLPLV